MNRHTHTIGDGSSVISRFGSENGRTRPEKVVDVVARNDTGGTLFLQIFEVGNSLIPFGTAYSGAGGYTLTGLTVGHTYSYATGASEVAGCTLTNGAQVFTVPAAGGATQDNQTASISGTFVATATTLVIAGATNSALITADIEDTGLTPAGAGVNNAQVPAEGSSPKFSFPVQANLGGTLGEEVDMRGIFVCWSSTAATKTIALANSGSIQIIIKG